MTDMQVIALMATSIYANASRDDCMSAKWAVAQAIEIFVIAREETERIHEQN